MHSKQPPSVRLGILNRRPVPHRVAVEPWAIEYTLSAGEALVIVATGSNAVPRFEVVEWDGITQVHCDDAAVFRVMQGDHELPAGYEGRERHPAVAVRHLPGSPFA